MMPNPPTKGNENKVKIECEECDVAKHIEPTDNGWHYHEGCGGRMRVSPGQFEEP